MANRAEILKQKFQNSLALPFAQVLPERVIQQVFQEQGVHYRKMLSLYADSGAVGLVVTGA